MNIFRDFEALDISASSAVTVGSFDGLHLGHQQIIEELLKSARLNSLASVLMTFDPHPQNVLSRGKSSLPMLTSTEEKLEIIRDLGVDNVVIIPFTRKFASLSPKQFVVEILLAKAKMAMMIVGFNHHFGKNRAAGYRELKALGQQLGFSASKVEPLYKNQQIISSTAIRNMLQNGRITEANQYLGRGYSLSGKVVPGDARGRKIGFPTANLQLPDSDKLTPAAGVYAVDVKLSNGVLHKGMMNIGVRPTFDIDVLTLEVHLFSFEADLYGQTLQVFFKQFVRHEKKFSGIDALKTQLLEDQKICEKI